MAIRKFNFDHDEFQRTARVLPGRCSASFKLRVISSSAWEGTSLLEIADVLGHTSVRVAGRYSHLMQDHKRMNLERMVGAGAISRLFGRKQTRLALYEGPQEAIVGVPGPWGIPPEFEGMHALDSLKTVSARLRQLV